MSMSLGGGISAIFIRRPVATSLFMAAIFFAGVMAYPFLPVSAIPQVDFPTVQVAATLPGGSPEVMAATVAQPLERQFAQIAGVTQMTSTSYLGVTTITVQFELDRNLDGAAQDIQAAIAAAASQLPRNLPAPPRYEKFNPADSPIIGYAFQSDVLPLIEVSDAVENIIVQQLAQIGGVGSIGILGQQKPAIRIQIDPLKLAAVGLSFEDVRETIVNASTSSPKGLIDVGPKSYTILGNDQITEAEPFNDVILAFRNGAPVRIRDVGRAVPGPENTRVGSWRYDGKRAIGINVRKQPGANVVETVENIEKVMPQLIALLPAAINTTRYYDRVQTIRASVAEVRLTLVITAVLVVVVIFIFLRSIWATVIPALAIPLSVVGTFAGMYLFGFSIDNLSLMALTIAIGFVVDDAIVMLENIYRHIERGMPPFEAALKGSSEIAFTIISMSLSLVSVFIPLLLMDGIIGKIFHEFAMTVTIAILISGVVSLTLTPMLCSKFLRHTEHKQTGHVAAIDRAFNRLSKFYERTLDGALRRQPLFLGIFVVTVGLSIALYILVPKGFFPLQDAGVMVVNTDAALDISFEEMGKRQEQVRAIIAADPDVVALMSNVGAGSVGTARSMSNGIIFTLLRPHKDRDASVFDIIDRLRPKFAQLEGVRAFPNANQDLQIGGRGTRTQYQYTLQSVDADQLNEASRRITDKLTSLPELRDVVSDQQIGAATATLAIDRDQAARFGIQPQLIDDILYNAFGQRQVAQYFTQINTYKVILEALPEMQNDLRTLDRIFVKSPSTGEQVPLSTFVKRDMRPGTTVSVNHQGQFPAVTISFNLAPGVALSEAVDAIERAQVELNVPDSVNGTFQGAARAFQDSLASQPYLIGAAILAVYLILGMLYESYIYPLAILSTLPSAGVGAMLILILAQYDLSVIALIGVILLIGLVKKNGIMMVDFAINAMRDRNATPYDAIREACLIRFRPIMMTSTAALLGGVPLIIAGGAGYELRRPLGLAMVGGLLVSQVLTLYTTPVVFLYLERLRERMKSRRQATANAPVKDPVKSPAE
jgi:HAE1 family hydrophobic/amphiphilic exporter-1